MNTHNPDNPDNPQTADAEMHTRELLDYLLAVNSHDEMLQVLESLLTPAELSEITKRLQIFRMLEAGVPQRKIAEQLGVGIATVSRGSRVLSTQGRKPSNT
ncbi:Trp family transcriptional regulator [Nitrincola sp. MINF-07-Sa-05]|uniref:Trp family transcriptional regulator n=1 Tax=Nitrincola salilacus TaxID=3400273 RepID=UPI0039182979